MFVQGITNGILVVRWGAESNISPRYTMAYLTNLNFSHLEDKDARLKSNTCCKYLTPPWISLVDFELAPAPKSSLSINRVLMPLVEASRRTPTPLHPPPMTKTSYLGLFST